MLFKPADFIQDIQNFGEFGGVNPSISDSATYTFLAAKTMQDTFEGHTEGCYLYSRHASPSTLYLGDALARMEGTQSALVTGSGMGAITSVILQLCKADDHMVSSRTIYGGTYAFMKNFLPRLNIKTSFVDITCLEKVEAAITNKTKMIYCETISNPLLEVANIPALAKLAQKYNIPLVVDNTFSPLMVSSSHLGATITIHSLTKFINGTNDTIGGVVCASKEFIDSLRNVNDGAAMLLGPVMDSLRAAQILKNMRTLAIRMRKHSDNAMYLATQFQKEGLTVVYPGLENHKGHVLLKSMLNETYGFGGLLTLELESLEKANELMELMQHRNIGYLAVSLGFYKTLFSASGASTSSEIPEEEQKEMGLSKGLIRFSIGLDDDIERTYQNMKACMQQAGIL
ncbi:MAG: aminotransferase class I/II-fold pyridoxal phosphate-dependent enzyme [Flavobacteriaceae bacterium]|nr:aminotransferase class I/II-fold pyridoxal phosphate-dependent enzyme [Flavobacteriaceae bacterium]